MFARPVGPVPFFVFFPFFVGEGNKKRKGAQLLLEDVLPCTLLL